MIIFRNTWALFAAILLTGVANGQNSNTDIPFPTVNASWLNTGLRLAYGEEVPHYGSAPYYVQMAPVYYCMNGEDTLISGMHYTKVNLCGTAYRGALRDNGHGKVYFIAEDSLQEHLLYDFRAQVGDTLNDVYMHMGGGAHQTAELKDLVVDSTDQVFMAGENRRRVFFRNNAEYAEWIEGIGCSWGLFAHPVYDIRTYDLHLTCMSAGGMVLYPDYNSGNCMTYLGVAEIGEDLQAWKVYPNPSDAWVTFESGVAQDKSMLHIFNTLGEVVFEQETDKQSLEVDFSNFPSGVYVARIVGKQIFQTRIVRN